MRFSSAAVTVAVALASSIFVEAFSYSLCPAAIGRRPLPCSSATASSSSPSIWGVSSSSSRRKRTSVAAAAAAEPDGEEVNGDVIATAEAAFLSEVSADAARKSDDDDESSSSADVDSTSEEVESAKDEEEVVLCDVPPASYDVESTTDGPSGSTVHTLTIHLGKPGHPDPLVLQTGKIGRQASGAVTLTRGDTVLYATASRDKDPRDAVDFVPLSVEHQERFSSAGMTSGSFNKRDGRPAEHEILVCRLIDRPLRPLIDPRWRHETQLLSWVLSYDGVRSPDPLAIVACSAALWISDVPLSKPVAAVMVGRIGDQFVLNPTNDQMEQSRLHLTVAGTRDAVLMIEGAADFLPEELMIEAVEFGHGAIRTICEGVEELGKVAGKEKKIDTLPDPIEGLQEAVDDLMTDKIDAMYAVNGDKASLSSEMSALSRYVMDELEPTFPDDASAIKAAFKDLLCRRMFERAKSTNLRCDGRKLDEVRRIDVEAGLFPRVHGSALFTRGETQAVATATLGDSGMKQKIDKISGMEQKRFYLQYSFPPSCVGETGRVGMPGRREVGHGNLAERALIPTLPSEKDFPYSIRVESLITESNGSSSMASVCGGCLALMDAGVPIKSPVAGIAMGMLLGDKGGVSDENAVILSDILGSEDALGTMDFKVAGDRNGITTFQLDIKCEGLTLETMKRALEQAKVGRLHILNEMEKTLGKPREDLPPTVPRIGSLSIPEETIGRVIGPGGKQIRAIIEDFDLINMDVQEDGTVQITSMNTTKIEQAKEMIEALTKTGPDRGRGGGGGRRTAKAEYVGPQPEVGKTYKGKIKGIHQFGVFLEILPGPEDGSTPGLEGLCHVSELHVERVRNCEGYVRSLNTEEIEVKFLGVNEKGQIQLSRKAVLEEQNGKGGSKSKSSAAPTKMSQDEVDVIAQAIEGVQDL